MFGVSDIFIILLGFGAFELGFYLGMKTEGRIRMNKRRLTLLMWILIGIEIILMAVCTALIMITML